MHCSTKAIPSFCGPPNGCKLRTGTKAANSPYCAEPEGRLERAAASDTATYKLAVKNTITDSTYSLHFYDHRPDKNTHFQAELRRDAFTPTWQSQLNAQWFAKLRQGWTDKWFAELGRYNQITRKNNAILEIKLAPDKFHVIFNRHPDASPSEAFLPRPVPNFTEAETTKYFSKDLAPILFNLADAPAAGAVTMAGNKHALVFTYETSVGQFEIAVPTLDDETGNRDGTLFYAADRKL
jgi:hypothetical protein